MMSKYSEQFSENVFFSGVITFYLHRTFNLIFTITFLKKICDN